MSIHGAHHSLMHSEQRRRARRIRAYERFYILPFDKFSEALLYDTPEEYDSYTARKTQELESLKASIR